MIKELPSMPPVVKSPNSSSSESPKLSRGGGVELTSGGNAILCQSSEMYNMI